MARRYVALTPVHIVREQKEISQDLRTLQGFNDGRTKLLVPLPRWGVCPEAASPPDLAASFLPPEFISRRS